MAEEKKEAAPAAGGKGGKKAAGKKGAIGLILLMAAFGAAVPFILPSLLLLVGMVPTLAALFADSDRNHSSVTAIGAMNAAGITPLIVELWEKGQTVDNALLILRNPDNWLLMLGAAALGQLIMFAVPHAIAAATVARDESRLLRLKDNLEKLKTTWGPDVATTKPLDRIARGE